MNSDVLAVLAAQVNMIFYCYMKSLTSASKSIVLKHYYLISVCSCLVQFFFCFTAVTKHLSMPMIFLQIYKLSALKD